jgi:hypothetical protein
MHHKTKAFSREFPFTELNKKVKVQNSQAHAIITVK